MRKLAFLAVTALVLVFTATASAQQVNQYTITGGTNPKAKGSKKKPRPIGIKFGFEVDEASGLRPAVVEKYAIRFNGTRVNTSVAANCRKSVLEARGPDACPSRSIVGTGFIENQTGNSADPNDKSIECNAALYVVNHGRRNASIYVEGDPNQSDRRRRCAISLAAAIPAKFRNTTRYSELSFVVPSSLRHPGAPTISNAVKSVTSTIKRITRRGKGFYEAIGGCTRNRRDITVQFRTEAGKTDNVKRAVNCS
jgi:hypothetical protein